MNDLFVLHNVNGEQELNLSMNSIALNKDAYSSR